MRHEIWKDPETGEAICCAADASGDEARALLTNRTLLQEFDAATPFEVMSTYHTVMGYEPFATTDPFYFIPFESEPRKK